MKISESGRIKRLNSKLVQSQILNFNLPRLIQFTLELCANVHDRLTKMPRIKSSNSRISNDSHSQRLQRTLETKRSGSHSSQTSHSTPSQEPYFKQEISPEIINLVDSDTDSNHGSGATVENLQFAAQIGGGGVDPSSPSSSSSSDSNSDPEEPETLPARTPRTPKPTLSQPIDLNENLPKKVAYKARDGTIKKRYRPG